MNNQTQQFIFQVLDQLKQSIEPIYTPNSLDGLIAYHFDTLKRLQRVLVWQSLQPSIWVKENSDYLSQAPHLGTLGALLAANATNHIDEDAAHAFHTGLSGLQRRGDDFSSSTAWVLQPSTVLGIGLGIRFIGDTELRTWFVDLITKGFERKTISPLSRLMYGYVLDLFSVTQPRMNVSSLVGDAHTCSLSELGLGIWLARQEIGDWSQTHRVDWIQASQTTFLTRIITEELYETGDYKAALLWEVATASLQYVSTPVNSWDQISHVLANFPAALERWKKDWRIEDEIDIQRLVFLILRSYFDDLQYEENLPKLGRSGHRYDIGIPQLKLLIEIKYARKPADFQRFVDEIGKDAAQIHTQTTYTNLIVFIFDMTCTTENYAWTRDGMRRFAPVKDVVIICAPTLCR